MREGPVLRDTFLGALLAGGGSTRYGEPKALAPLAGRPMAAWPLEALSVHFSQVVLLSHDEVLARALGLPHRKDRTPGQGPLGGLVTGLHWARELGLDGIFLLACDLPLVDGALVGRILAHGLQGTDALVPSSNGPLGLEPLCAAYTLACGAPAEALLASGRRSMMGLLEGIAFTQVPLAELGGGEGAGLSFRNVNTPEEGKVVEEILRRGPRPPDRFQDGVEPGSVGKVFLDERMEP